MFVAVYSSSNCLCGVVFTSLHSLLGTFLAYKNNSWNPFAMGEVTKEIWENLGVILEYQRPFKHNTNL